MLRTGRQGIGVEAVIAPSVERPEQKQEIGCGRLEQRRHVDVEGAEAHAIGAKLGAGALVEFLDLARHRVAAKHAERLGEAEGEAAGKPGEV